jgi:CubicO group peptidase (beta-lactamase class C family)
MRRLFPFISSIALLLIGGCASTAVPPPAPDAMLEMRLPDPVEIILPQRIDDLQAVADAMREQTGTPGLALAVVRNGGMVARAVSGLANAETGAPLVDTSRFHWGSVVKSVTGTVVGQLIAEGRLRADTTVVELLGELEMQEGYRDVTIAQLMRHEAGVPAYADFGPPELDRFTAYSGTAAQKRLAFVSDLLREVPVSEPGEKFQYSNAGIVLAAVMAEQATGESWEDLVRAYVFTPAGMVDAGFGLPSTPAKPEGTRGHLQFPGQPSELLPLGMFGEINPMLAPAGDVSSSIDDFARYAAFHLAGLRGEVAGVPAKAFEIVHTAAPDALPISSGMARYSYGWEILQWPLLGGRRTHWHNGSNGAFYAEIRLVPELNTAVVIMANTGGPIAYSSEKSLARIFEYYAGI